MRRRDCLEPRGAAAGLNCIDEDRQPMRFDEFELVCLIDRGFELAVTEACSGEVDQGRQVASSPVSPSPMSFLAAACSCDDAPECPGGLAHRS